MSESTMGAAAHEYADRGWKVVRVHAVRGNGRCSCGRAACPSPGKHPWMGKGWWNKATTDHDEIERLWTEKPWANVGLATGVTGLFDAVDIDGPPDLLPEPVTGPTVLTSRGQHVYMLPTGAGCPTGVLPHVDWRGRGGMVVAPPSGGRQWHDELGPDTPIIRAPDVLFTLLGVPSVPAGASGPAALAAEVARVRAAREGSRRDTLNKAAFKLGALIQAGRLDEGEVKAQLSAAAADCAAAPASQPFTVDEIETTITTGIRDGREKATAPRGSFATAEAAVGDDPLLVVNGILGVTLTGFRRLTGDEAVYEFVGPNGVGRVTPKQLADQRYSRPAIHEATGAWPTRVTGHQYDNHVLPQLDQAATPVDLGPGATERGRVRAYVRDFVAAHVNEDPLTREDRKAFRQGDRVHLVGHAFRWWARKFRDERLPPADFARMMRAAGCSPVGEDVWEVPADLAPAVP